MRLIENDTINQGLEENNMTEETLNKAIAIKNQMETIRTRKSKLDGMASLCYGNTSEVRARKFTAQISDNNHLKEVCVSNKSLKFALDMEISDADETLDRLLAELDQLH